MAFRLYIVPVIGSGAPGDVRRPKYFDDGSGTITPSRWSATDYGMEPWMVVGADLASADDAAVVAQPDAFGLPVDLSPNLTAGQVAAVQAKLEAANIPADWVSTAFTWAEVVRIVLGMFTFLQRFAFVSGVTPLFSDGIDLTRTFASLSAPIRTALLDTATAFALDTTGLTGAATLRVILKSVGAQLKNQPFNFNGTLV